MEQSGAGAAWVPSPSAPHPGGSGAWVGIVEGLRPRSLSAQMPVRSPEPGVPPGKPADSVSHTLAAASPGSQPLAGGASLDPGRLQRVAELWRRGSKGREEAAFPSPNLSPKLWAVTARASDSEEAGYITEHDSLLPSFILPQRDHMEEVQLCSEFLGLRGPRDHPPACGERGVLPIAF